MSNFPHRRPSLVVRPEPTSAIEVVQEAAAAAGMPVSPLDAARAAAGVHVNSPANEQKPWGSPFPAPPAPSPTEQRTTDDSGNSWGRTDTIPYTARPQEMCRVELSPSEMVTLTITTTEPPGLGTFNIAPSIPLYVWANVTYGGGSTNATRRVRCDDYLSVPLVVAWLQVACYLGDIDGNPVQTQPFNNTPSAQVNVQVARGVRGIPGQATVFKSNTGVNFGMANSPVRVASISAHLTIDSGGAEQYLQLFDSATAPPPGGAVPTAEYALGETPWESDIGDTLRYLNPRGFGQGLQVAVSTTSGTLTVSGVPAWVEVELVQL
jgi:hypothetical protein